MPELKKNFTAGRMNKDLDERLIPNGEYRDAMNIQVKTTESEDGAGNAGTIQNIPGNKKIAEATSAEPYVNITTVPNKTTIISSVADEKNNKAYFFIAGPNLDSVLLIPSQIDSERVFIDTIMEVDTGTSTDMPQSYPVVVDRWCVLNTKQGVFGNNDTESGVIQELTVDDGSKYRIGMSFEPIDASGNLQITNINAGVNGEPTIIQNIIGNVITLRDPVSVVWNSVASIIFRAPRVLNFDNSTRITGINILDDMLFWTDGKTEPKKINIARCKAGSRQSSNSLSSADWLNHTQLRLKNPIDNEELVPWLSYDEDGDGSVEADEIGLETSLARSINNDLREEHITVIRKAPTYAPTLDMSDTLREGVVTLESYYFNFTLAGSDNGMILPGDEVTIGGDNNDDSEDGDFPSGLGWLNGDIVTWKEETIGGAGAFLTVKINEYDEEEGDIEFTVVSISDNLLTPNEDVGGSGYWTVKVEERKPLFELKFVRFGCRYKYEDGEYSSFGPWSEIAFLPSKFDYDHRKGYNLGMTNSLRDLTIKNFIPHQSTRGGDVVAVDILFKTTESPNVYSVKTITRGKDIEWDLFVPGNFSTEMLTGELNITSEMIHRAIDKNQLLRSWDNVPRLAKAQEAAANRIIYANYLQGYDIKDSVGIKQKHLSYEIFDGKGKKSVKSIREYRFGMVFGDYYGRETPVISPGYVTGDASNEFSMLQGDSTIEKEFAAFQNKFQIKQEWSNAINDGTPDQWMEYVKYFVKETSNEYYNLVMDRWYDAEDGNVWISFPSADRNKIDEETYLILKNEHGNNIPVIETARYKIIAIEDDAPDFIKLDPRYMGKVRIGTEQGYTTPQDVEDAELDSLFTTTSYDPESDSPSRLMGYDREITFTDNFAGILKGHVLSASDRTLKCRICAETSSVAKLCAKNWHTVSFHYTSDADPTGNTGIVRWQTPMGEDADMIDKFQTNFGSTTGLRYYMEFQENVVLNQAEFDGRFFVKIQKDDVLSNRVLKFSSGSQDFDSIASFQMAYIETTGQHPASSGADTTGPYTNYTWQDSSISGAAIADHHTCDGSDTFDNIFGHQWEDFGWVQIEMMGMGCEPNESWAGVEMALGTRKFWNWFKDTAWQNTGTKLFIDSARANHLRIFGSWCGNCDEFDGTPDNFCTEDGIKNPQYYQPTGVDPGQLTYLDGDYDVSPTGSELGRIAFSLIPYYDWDWNNSPEEFAFMQLMTTEGTMFKFKGDPGGEDGDGYLYKVVSRGGPLNANMSFGAGGDVDFWKKSHTRNMNNTAQGSDSDSSNGYTETLYFENGNNITTYNAGQDLSYLITSDDFTYQQPNIENAQEMVSYNGLSLMRFNSMCRADANGVWNNSQNSYRGSTSVCCNGSGESACSGGASNDDYYGCQWCKSYDTFCQRTGFRVEFRKCNPDGTLVDHEDNGPGGAGIDRYEWDPRGEMTHDGRSWTYIQIWGKSTNPGEKVVPTADAAVWETEPKEDVGLDIYYEASNAIPMVLTNENTVDFAPYNCKVTQENPDGSNNPIADDYNIDYYVSAIGYTGDRPVLEIRDSNYNELAEDDNGWEGTDIDGSDLAIGNILVFHHKDGTKTRSAITGYYLPVGTVNNMSETVYEPTDYRSGYYAIDPDVWQYPIDLGWSNCWSFGNGVESDRIRDDYNALQIDNGVKVSSSFDNYGEELKSSTMIYSGIFNAISSVNNLNEFNMAEKITKDLNPSYGSIQALKTRDTNLVAFCEDKILQVTTNKDALYNADGNPQLIATNRVLGTAVPFGGDYGISKNPESLAVDQFRIYFSDMQRGAVLRLSNDGITPISSIGMKTYFRDNLKKTDFITGSFDTVNGEYNLTLDFKQSQGIEDVTISYNEDSKGWVSFKSFIPQSGLSVSGKYFTAVGSKVYEHYVSLVDTDFSSNTLGEVINRNTFYPEPPYTISNMESSYTPSHVSFVFNDLPGSVKVFNSVNYEGSQGKVISLVDGTGDPEWPSGVQTPNGVAFTMPYDSGDGEYYNLKSKRGWFVERIKTDLSFKGAVQEFKDKEGKWFNYVSSVKRGGINENPFNDLNEFSVQGLGTIQDIDGEAPELQQVQISINSDMIDNTLNPFSPLADNNQ
mgnify:CR=1 FL=1|tara:strand:- start:15275 stop:21577 length:6303 start_codon:yes stop_codon:yes gene_type:complete